MSKLNKMLATVSTSTLAFASANASAAVVVCACGRVGDVVACICAVF